MTDLHIKAKEYLKNCKEPFSDNNNYQKAMRFGDDSLKNELQGYIDYIKARNENEAKEKEYQFALSRKRINTETVQGSRKNI